MSGTWLRIGGGAGLAAAAAALSYPWLLSRNRIATPHASALTRLFNLLVMEPGSLVMERKMLLGIKERAQRLAGGRGQPDPAAPARA